MKNFTVRVCGGKPDIGNDAKSYLFCGGIGECRRRLEQIERGTLRVFPFPPIRNAKKKAAEVRA